MRITHFETFKPICPRCRHEQQTISTLKLEKIISGTAELIIEGLLHCTNSNCRMEYPIIDGIPFILPNLRQFISDNLFHICQRNDFSEDIQSVLGDCAGPSTVFDATRQHLSSYGWDHYGDLVDQTYCKANEVSPGNIVRLLERASDLLPKGSRPNILDIGCSVGRNSFELAEKNQGLVLGVDVNISMLRVAQRVLRQGHVKFPLRRIGIVYDEVCADVQFKHKEYVDFWACDAQALPFADNTFQLATAFNVLDSVQSPRDLLLSIASVLKTNGHALLSTPFDWNALATPLETWIGGHSQRGPDHGAAEPLLKALLTPGQHPQSIPQLTFLAEIPDQDWWVRVHDRSSTLYKTHIIAAEKMSK